MANDCFACLQFTEHPQKRDPKNNSSNPSNGTRNQSAIQQQPHIPYIS
jgi:hypothetical protein